MRTRLASALLSASFAITFGLTVGCTETKTTVPGAEADVGAVVDDDLGGFDGGDAATPPADSTGSDTAQVDATNLDDAAAPDDAILDDTGTVDPDVGTTDAVDADDTTSIDTNPPDTTGPVTPPLDARTCTLPFTFTASGAAPGSVAVAGEFNAWSTSEATLSDSGGGAFTGELDISGIAAGSYAYKLVLDGNNWILDPAQPMRKVVGGIENSKLLVPDCHVPSLEVETLDASPAHLKVVVAVRDGQGSTGITPSTATVLRGGTPFDAGSWSYDAASQRFTVDMASPAAGKYGLTFTVGNGAGSSEPLYLPIWVEAAPFTWNDAVLYFVMTDRFKDGDPANNGTTCTDASADWRGGDFAGLLERIESGYFDELGIRAIWLTAVIDNPSGCMPGSADGRSYASYHGYFPASQTKLEEHLGTLEQLQAISAAAHARGLRLLVDLVANHLHQTHPLVGQHQNDGWFNTQFSCQNGGFDSAPLTCWFEPYLPDLNYENDGPVEAMTEMALNWVRIADLDGYRVDAVKHMHSNFLRTLVYKLRHEVETVPGARFYLVGETFTGDWGGGSGPNETLIKSYVGPDLLDGQFDFPLYWAVIKAFGRFEAGLDSVASLLTAEQGYYGTDGIMSAFLGNHDVPRFVSHAAGQIGDVWGNGSKDQGWTNPPALPSASAPFERLALGFTFLFTAPGIPMVYYGDEIGLPGAGDPDNRRMMPWTGYSAAQQTLFDRMKQLGTARKNLAALRRGDYATLKAETDLLVFRRTAGADRVIVGLNRSGTSKSVTVPATDGAYTDALTGDTATASGGSLTFDIPALGARIWAP